MATIPDGWEMSDELMEAFRKLNKSILEGMERDVFSASFTGEYKKGESFTVEREEGFWNRCEKCGEPLELHRDGECPTIIDAEFIKEEPPKLPSGKE